MLQKCIAGYSHFFDIHIRSTSSVVLMIACMIAVIGVLFSPAHAVPELRAAPENVIWIEGIAYEVKLQKLSER